MKNQIKLFYLKNEKVLRVLFVLAVTAALAAAGGAPSCGSGGP